MKANDKVRIKTKTQLKKAGYKLFSDGEENFYRKNNNCIPEVACGKVGYIAWVRDDNQLEVKTSRLGLLQLSEDALILL